MIHPLFMLYILVQLPYDVHWEIELHTGGCVSHVVSLLCFFRIVRSEQEYRFNLSNVARTEKVLTAELHLFKLRPQSTVAFNRHHFCQVNISWIRSGGK